MSKSRLPMTDSIQELARFWDTHELTDFDDELEEVQEAVFAHTTPITLHLQTPEIEAVRTLARSKGIAEVELIQAWVREKLHVS